MISLGDAVLNLGVNSNKLTSGLRKVASSIKTGIGTAAKIAAAAIATMTAAIYAFSAAALFKFTEAGDKISKMSQQTGIAAETLSKLRYAAEASGSSIESLYGAYNGLAPNVASAIAGDEALIATFHSLGVSINDLKTLAPGDLFLKVGDGLSKLPDGFTKAGASLKIFGDVGVELLPFFNLGAEGMQKLMNKTDEFGTTFTAARAKLADDLSQSYANMKESFNGIMYAVAEQLAPGIIWALEKITNFIVENREVIVAGITWIAEIVGKVMTWLGNVLANWMPNKETINGWREWWVENWGIIVAITKNAGEVLSNIFWILWDALRIVFYFISAAFVGMVDGMLKSWNDLNGKSGEESKSAGETLKDFSERVREFTGKIREKFDEWVQNIREKWTDIQESFADGTSLSIEELVRFVTFIVRLGNGISAIFKHILVSIVGFSTGVATVIAAFSVPFFTIAAIILAPYKFIAWTIKDIYTNITDNTKSWKEAFLEIWVGIKKSFSAIIEAIISPIKRLLQWIQDMRNGVTDLNKFKDWLFGGDSEDDPPGNARGTNWWKGGMSLVGEEGPELVSMPTGSKVFDNNDTMDMLRADRGSVTQTFNVVVNGVDKSAQQISNEIGELLNFKLRMRGATV